MDYRGIKEINFWNGIFIIRPLLIFKKEKLKNYVEQNNIKFFDDKSNAMLKYERVRTRKTLMVMQEKLWPNINDDLYKYGVLNKKLIGLIDPYFIKWKEENVVIDELGAIKINFENLKNTFFKI